MSKFLLDESPQTYQRTMAVWIGLNEAVFLQQLHYILTQNDNVGKFADGLKWYRDKPRDFMVKYFPFWDEGTVKRTIANLRADALILARSDLNKDPKDRSLWYTVNYPAVERLNGQVERITRISEMRKEARKARIPKRDSSLDYAKVQSVPLTDEAETGTEVQYVPDDKSAKCTDDNQQNVLLTEVQNVPTPKESLPKESLPKEFSPQQKLFLVLAKLCHIDLSVASDKQKGQLNQSSKAMCKAIIDLDQFKAKFPKYWQQMDWRGKQGQPPTPPQIQEVYGDYCHWLESGESPPPQNGVKQHGSKPTNRANLADPANFAAQLEAVSNKPRPPGG